MSSRMLNGHNAIICSSTSKARVSKQGSSDIFVLQGSWHENRISFLEDAKWSAGIDKQIHYAGLTADFSLQEGGQAGRIDARGVVNCPSWEAFR